MKRSLPLASSFLCGAFVLSCGGASIDSAVSVSETPAEALVGETDAEPAATLPPLPPGQLRRADVLRVLDEGPGRLLSRVVTEPMLDKGRFVGFRVKAFNGEPPEAPRLEVADVLLTLNGQALERPEQLFAALESLRVAKTLEVAVLRQGERVVLSYEIVE